MKKLLTLLLLLISISTFAQKIKLALNLKTDSTYYLVTNANLSIIQDIPGHKQTVDMIIAAKASHKVTAIRDSVYDMEVKYISMSVHVGVGTVNIDMNSADKNGANPLSKMLGGILNVPFSMTITKAGRVLTVNGLEKLFANLSASFPEATEAQKAQFKAQMQQSFSEKSIRTNFQDAFAVFPKRNVGVNDTWAAASELESAGINAHIKTTYTLKEITGDAYLVHGDGGVAQDANSTGYRQTNGMEMRFVNIKGTQTTALKLDKNTCWIIESKVTKNISGTVDIKDSPKMPGGLTFPMTVIGDLTTSRK